MSATLQLLKSSEPHWISSKGAVCHIYFNLKEDLSDPCDQPRLIEDSNQTAVSIDQDLVQVARYTDKKLADDAGLVLLAAGIPYWLFANGDLLLLHVSVHSLDHALTELKAFDQLKRTSHREAEGLVTIEASYWSFLWVAFVLITIFVLQGISDIATIGRLDAIKLRNAEDFWRPATALTLHGDIVHLASNLVSGFGFALLLMRTIGPGFAWLNILVVGFLANLANAWIHYPEQHLSIGASTAVFGTLGALTGAAFYSSLVCRKLMLFSNRAAPILAGLALLGLFGAGNGVSSNVDISAHVLGFLFGLVSGLLIGRYQKRILELRRYDLWAGSVCLFSVALLWIWALSSS